MPFGAEYFIYLDINCLLLKIDKFRYIAKHIYARVIEIYESKLDISVLTQEISLNNYKTLHYDSNGHEGGVAVY